MKRRDLAMAPSQIHSKRPSSVISERASFNKKSSVKHVFFNVFGAMAIVFWNVLEDVCGCQMLPARPIDCLARLPRSTASPQSARLGAAALGAEAAGRRASRGGTWDFWQKKL